MLGFCSFAAYSCSRILRRPPGTNIKGLPERRGLLMVRKAPKTISRREFFCFTGASLIISGAAVSGPFFLFPARAEARRKKLRILQWKHFLPSYDEWFSRIFAKQWGETHDTRVVVDHLPLEKIRARASAERIARSGHDLVLFLSPPATYEADVIDHSEVYQEVQRKNGQVIQLGHKSTFNPKTRKYFAFSDSYVPLPMNWRSDLWEQVGLPLGPTDYDVLRRGGKKIRDGSGIPCGLGLAPELDSNVILQGVLWSFGGFVQDERGQVILNSKGTIEALKYVRALYAEAEKPEVLRWGPASNDRAMLAGKVSCVMNAISIPREAERERPKLSGRILVNPAPTGPANWLACPHVTQCYVIWNFAENQEGAKQFLADLIDNFGAGFQASRFCNFPCFPKTVPDLLNQLSNDPKAEPHGKYKALRDTLHWTRNVGHPGYATAAIAEVFDTFVIPRMFAEVAEGKLSPSDAANSADKQVKQIFEKWLALKAR